MATQEVIPATLDDIHRKQDRNTLGVLLAGIKKWKTLAKEAEIHLKGDKRKGTGGLEEEALLLLQGHSIKTMSYQEKLFTVTETSKTSFSRQRLVDAMMKGNRVHPKDIAKILKEAGSETAYTALTMRDEKQSTASEEYESEVA